MRRVLFVMWLMMVFCLAYILLSPSVSAQCPNCPPREQWGCRSDCWFIPDDCCWWVSAECMIEWCRDPIGHERAATGCVAYPYLCSSLYTLCSDGYPCW